MKFVIIAALALVAVVAAAPQQQPEPVPIIRSDFEKQPDGGYDFAYQTGDGIERSEKGEVKQVLDEENKPHDVVVVRGSISYTDPEGHPQVLSYYADETGYHAEGDAIPKAPARR